MSFKSSSQVETVIYIFSICISSLYALYTSDVYSIGNFNFYLYTFLFVLNIISTRCITFIQMWLLGFIYIIIPEMLFVDNNILIDSVQYIIIGNNLLIFGYFIINKSTKFSLKETKTYREPRKERGNKTIVFTFFTILLLIYIYCVLPNAVATMTLGRYIAGQSVPVKFRQLADAIGYTLPAIIGWYHCNVLDSKRKIIKSTIWSLPIFLLLVIKGSRFPLLFSLLGFLFSTGIITKKLSSRILTKVIIVFILIVIFIPKMIEMRTLSQHNSALTEEINDNYSISQEVASNFTIEGVVNMTNEVMKYCEKHDFMYGKSNLFTLYFWVPRSIWETKPVMLGAWLPKYLGRNVQGESVSTGIFGELYIDFGYLSLLILILLGVFLKILDNTVTFYMVSNNVSTIFYSFLFSYIFFCVRSPLTSTQTLIYIYIIYSIFKKVLYSNIKT